MKTSKKNKSMAVELYDPKQVPARRGNTDLAKRGSYLPSPYEGEEVLEGRVSIYKPEPQHRQKERPTIQSISNAFDEAVWLIYKIAWAIGIVCFLVFFGSFGFGDTPIPVWFRNASLPIGIWDGLAILVIRMAFHRLFDK